MSDENNNSTGILNVVVDLSHHNNVSDFKTVREDGILGVIHKATQGTVYTDPTYTGRKPLALEAGLMWGAYHFGTGGNGRDQAKHFLEAVNPDKKDLPVLDLEENSGGTSMNLGEAENFISYVFENTGRWPLLYSNYYYIIGLSGSRDSTVLGNCRFWLAKYGTMPKVPLPWTDWTMWQYTDGSNGPLPHEVAGIGPCDRDKFNGDTAELITLWGD